jgi:hypothetical protein
MDRSRCRFLSVNGYLHSEDDSTLNREHQMLSRWEKFQALWVSRSEVRPVLQIPVLLEIVVSARSEIEQIQYETQRLWALKQQYDAEAAMLDSRVHAAQKAVELERVRALSHRSPLVLELHVRKR